MSLRNIEDFPTVALDGGDLVLTNPHAAGQITLRIRPADATFSLEGGGEFALNGCQAGFYGSGNPSRGTSWRPFRPSETCRWERRTFPPDLSAPALAGKGAFELVVAGRSAEGLEGRLRFAVSDAVPGFFVRFEVDDEHDPSWPAVAPLRFVGGSRTGGGDARDWRVYVNGYQSWSRVRLARGDERDPRSLIGMARRVLEMDADADDPGRRGKRGNFASDWFTAIYDPKGKKGMVAGFVTGKRLLGRVVMVLGPPAGSSSQWTLREFWAVNHARPAGSNASEWFHVQLVEGSNPFRALREYARVAAAAMGARVPSRVPVGWCSWYYFYSRVTEADVLANLEFLRSHPDLPVDVVQLDDGYQAEVGDWTSVNEKFPRGLKFLADRIHEAGFKAGLWLAPFFASPKSRTYKEHPDWVLRNEKGKRIKVQWNWGAFQYALDVTRPEVREHLRKVFRVITKEWGFDVVKVDFVYALAVRGAKYHDPEATRASAYRLGMELVRECLGDAGHVLGCGAPLFPAVGLVDAMRIGPDTMAKWELLGWVGRRVKAWLPSLFPALKATVLRSFTNGLWWVSDPDCLVVRRRGDKSSLTDAEVKTQLTLFFLSNGQLFISDHLPNLPADRIEALRAVLPPLPVGSVAEPLDFMEGPLPAIYLLRLSGWDVLAWINWEGKPRGRVVRLERRWGFDPEKRYLAFEFWAAKPVAVLRGGQEFSTDVVEPHGCVAYRLTEVGQVPAVVGSSYHLSQGAVEVGSTRWDEGAGLFEVTMAGGFEREGVLWVHVPAGWELAGDAVAAGAEVLSVPPSGDVVIRWAGKGSTRTLSLRRDPRV
ncbi:MAG: hypothetical protein Kow0069_38520 [Promethearchaeota archaeon]